MTIDAVYAALALAAVYFCTGGFLTYAAGRTRHAPHAYWTASMLAVVVLGVFTEAPGWALVVQATVCTATAALWLRIIRRDKAGA